MDFMKKYPLSASELLHFPLMFPDSLKKYRIPGIDYATLETLYKFGTFCGISEGTIRTCVSRMKKEQYITSFTEKGIVRYRASALQLATMGNVVERKKIRNRGYLIAVYSFGSKEEKRRSLTRSLLTYSGFVRFAQNSYINIMIDETELRSSLKEEGLADNVYIFSVPSIGKAEMEKLVVAWNIPERSSFLDAFFRDTREFLEGGDGTDADAFNRAGIAWVAYIIHVQGTEPPLPKELFPGGYAFDEIYKYMQGITLKQGKRMYRYWREIT